MTWVRKNIHIMGISKNKSMAELTAGYETFIKNKELNKNGEELFNKAIKKVVKPKKAGKKK